MSDNGKKPNWRNWKVEVKRDAVARGLWNEFIRKRDLLRRGGECPESAWSKAAIEVLGEKFREILPPLATKLASEEKKARSKPTMDGEFEKATASKRAVVDWVADCLGRGRGERKWLCPTAKALYEWCAEHPGNRASFWTTMFSRLLPSKAQVDQEDVTIGSDGDNVLGVIRESLKDEHRDSPTAAS